MAKRQKMSKKASQKAFSGAGAMTNSLNTRLTPMRGGYRI